MTTETTPIGAGESSPAPDGSGVWRIRCENEWCRHGTRRIQETEPASERCWNCGFPIDRSCGITFIPNNRQEEAR